MPLPVSAETAGPARTAIVTATNVDTGRTVRRRTVRRSRNGGFRTELPPMPAGIYRLQVAQRDGTAVAPTTDLVTVLDPA
jgi:hypothetical protein